MYLNLDLMDLESVDRFADEFLRYVMCPAGLVETVCRVRSRTLTDGRSKENRLDILFANAGIMAT